MAEKKKTEKKENEQQDKQELPPTLLVKHKPVSLRGRTFKGTVVSDRMHKTVIVEWERKRIVRKYERFEKRKTRIYAHNPEEINAKVGDLVIVKETRPLSKTKHFVVIERIIA